MRHTVILSFDFFVADQETEAHTCHSSFTEMQGLKAKFNVLTIDRASFNLTSPLKFIVQM